MTEPGTSILVRRDKDYSFVLPENVEILSVQSGTWSPNSLEAVGETGQVAVGKIKHPTYEVEGEFTVAYRRSDEPWMVEINNDSALWRNVMADQFQRYGVAPPELVQKIMDVEKKEEQGDSETEAGRKPGVSTSEVQVYGMRPEAIEELIASRKTAEQTVGQLERIANAEEKRVKMLSINGNPALILAPRQYVFRGLGGIAVVVALFIVLGAPIWSIVLAAGLVALLFGWDWNL